MRTARDFSIALVVSLLSVASARTQCGTAWVPGDGVPGVDGSVNSTTTWDPDGSGPAQARLVVGGLFLVAGNMAANYIAAFDPTTGEWSSFGTGMNHVVTALAVLPNGQLVAAGHFTAAGGVPANRVARWDGTRWQAFGSGIENGFPYALTVLPNGDVIAAGAFSTAGGASVSNIARWDGTAWHALGSGMNSTVMATWWPVAGSRAREDRRWAGSPGGTGRPGSRSGPG